MTWIKVLDPKKKKRRRRREIISTISQKLKIFTFPNLRRSQINFHPPVYPITCMHDASSYIHVYDTCMNILICSSGTKHKTNYLKKKPESEVHPCQLGGQQTAGRLSRPMPGYLFWPTGICIQSPSDPTRPSRACWFQILEKQAPDSDESFSSHSSANPPSPAAAPAPSPPSSTPCSTLRSSNTASVTSTIGSWRCRRRVSKPALLLLLLMNPTSLCQRKRSRCSPALRIQLAGE